MKNLTQQKTKKLATKFFEYIDKYKQEHGGKYPKYKSSNFEYYTDVYMNLLICQEGLCAYTEMYIYEYSEEFKKEKYWENGRFNGDKLKIDADIEHFVPKSSCNLDCDWDWNNLFLAPIHINSRIKGSKIVYDFMRPDNPEYNPQKYFTYNFTTNRFVPKFNLSTKIREKVKYMLDVLGLNSSDTVKARRRSELLKHLNNSRKENVSFESLEKEVTEFPTAFKMSKDIFEDKKKQNYFLSIEKELKP